MDFITETCQKHLGERTNHKAVHKALGEALKSYPKYVGGLRHKVSRLNSEEVIRLILCLFDQEASFEIYNVVDSWCNELW